MKKWNIKEIGLKNLLLILGSGIVLLFLTIPDFLPKNTKKVENKNSNPTSITASKSDYSDETAVYVEFQEKRLKKFLENIEGIGEVEVMLTVSTSKEAVPLKDTPISDSRNSEKDSAGGTRNSSETRREESTVMAQSDGTTAPYVVKEKEPVVEGVVILAEGAENATLVKDVVEAVSALFDVPVHKIKVMKKK